MKKLHILWTNADIDTSRHMVLLYTPYHPPQYLQRDVKDSFLRTSE